jgi:glycosyltransferase involved in cell wall biosynthesis
MTQDRSVTSDSMAHVVVDARMAGDSGIGTYISNLLPRLAAQRPDWRLTILGDPDRLRALPWPGDAKIEIRECRARIYTAREQVDLVARAPRRPDLFWSPNYNIPLAYRGRLLVTVHDVAHLALPEFASGLHKQLYARTMFAATRRRATAILCDTAFTRDEYLRLVGTPRGEIHVVHLGVDDSWRTAASLAPVRSRPYIISVGNVKPHKNLGTLVRAFARIKDSIPHDLVIVGRREGLRTADQAVEASAATLDGRVEFTGEVPLPRLQAYIAHATALVAPSLYEGFGFPPLEAMAAGCPVIASRIATHHEVCGDAVEYCDPRNASDLAQRIERVVADQGLSASLRERGARRMGEFTWNQCAEQTTAVIANALARRRRSRDAATSDSVSAHRAQELQRERAAADAFGRHGP